MWSPKKGQIGWLPLKSSQKTMNYLMTRLGLKGFVSSQGSMCYKDISFRKKDTLHHYFDALAQNKANIWSKRFTKGYVELIVAQNR